MKKRVLSAFLALAMVLSLLPAMRLTAAAAETPAKKIMLGMGGIHDWNETDKYSYVYFGSYGEGEKQPVQWRVLDAHNTNMVDESGEPIPGAFLLSEKLLGSTKFYDYDDDENAWQGSVAQAWCRTFFTNAFSAGEQGAVLETFKSDDAFTSSTPAFSDERNKNFKASNGILASDRFFFLSAKEAENSAYGFTEDHARIANNNHNAIWWLRSPNNDSRCAGVAGLFGSIDRYFVTSSYAARPAFNLDTESVLFTSAAAGGKTDGALSAIDAYDGNDWKLTLLDASRSGFKASCVSVSVNEWTISYSGAEIGDNEYISAMVVNSAREATHYGRLEKVKSGANNEVTVNLAGKYHDGDTLYIFNEQCNGDKLTDYASAFVEVTLPEPVPYICYTYDEGAKKLEKHEDTKCTRYTPVTSMTTAFGDGKWYVANENVTVSSRITVSGTAHLILCNDATLKAEKGIGIPEDAELNIYAQTEEANMGKLIANGDNYCAGIGGSYVDGSNGNATGSGGAVTVHGGAVTANGGKYGAGIGGGDGGAGGTVTIYGGKVEATGGSYGAGIGGGYQGDGGTVTIYGGKVEATGGSYGAGIGGGKNSTGNGSLQLGNDVTFGAGDSKENITVWRGQDGVTANDALGKKYFASPCPHIHTWTYSEGMDGNANTITATCGGEGDCAYKNTGVTLTLTASDTAYTGNAVEASLDSTAWTGAGLNVPTITYEGSSLTDGKAVNVGSYTAKITIENASASVSFSISKAASTVTVPAAKENLHYTGSAQELVNAGSNVVGGTLKYSTTENGEYNTTIPTGTNAGDYSVWYKVFGDDNHVDTEAVKIEVTIGKADTTKEMLTYTAPANLIYDGSAKTASVTAKDEGSGIGEITVTYKQGETPVAAPIHAGTYDVFAAVNQGANYAAMEATKVGVLTILPKEVTLAWTNTTLTYNGEVEAPAAAAGGLVGTDTCTVTVTGGQTNAGTYTATAAELSNSNYKLPSDATCAFTVNPRVTIKLNGEVVCCGVDTALDGTYKLPVGTDLEQGVYQVVTETGDKTVTSILTVEKEQKPENLKVEIPSRPVSSVVTISGESTAEAKAKVSQTVVGGLDQVAKSIDTGNVESAKVELTVESKTEETVDEANKMKDLAGSGKTVEFLDVSIQKTIIGEDGSVTTTPVSNTDDKLIEIVLPFDFTGVDVSSVRVLRNHNGDATPMNKDPENGAEGYTVDPQAGTVTVYASKFSTYAVVYNQRRGSSGGGSNSITLPATVAHGKLSVDKRSPVSGETVTVTVTPDEGYKLGTLTVKDAAGNKLELTRVNDTAYTFKMPNGKVTVETTFVKATGVTACPKDATCLIGKFTDIDAREWYHDGIHYCVENNLMQGVSVTAFNPTGTTSRGMIGTMLARLDGETITSTGNNWYADGQAWAVRVGVSDGTNPTGNVTREQLAAMLYRYAKLKGYDVSVGEDTNILSYDDAFSVSEYAVSAMQWAVGAGIIKGDNNNLKPITGATRAEVATMLMRFCENMTK